MAAGEEYEQYSMGPDFIRPAEMDSLYATGVDLADRLLMGETELLPDHITSFLGQHATAVSVSFINGGRRHILEAIEAQDSGYSPEFASGVSAALYYVLEVTNTTAPVFIADKIIRDAYTAITVFEAPPTGTYDSW